MQQRSISQLQSKYKELKKLAKKTKANAARDLKQTGNVRLQSSTIRTLNDDTDLLALRGLMGPTATGFRSEFCSDADANEQPLRDETTEIEDIENELRKEAQTGHEIEIIELSENCVLIYHNHFVWKQVVLNIVNQLHANELRLVFQVQVSKTYSFFF